MVKHTRKNLCRYTNRKFKTNGMKKKKTNSFTIEAKHTQTLKRINKLFEKYIFYLNAR